MAATNATAAEAERIGRNIRLARKRRGLTQERLADELGLTSPHQISQWERGHVANLHSMLRLAAALQVPIAFFYDTPEPVTCIDGDDVDGIDLTTWRRRMHDDQTRIELAELLDLADRIAERAAALRALGYGHGG